MHQMAEEESDENVEYVEEVEYEDVEEEVEEEVEVEEGETEDKSAGNNGDGEAPVEETEAAMPPAADDDAREPGKEEAEKEDELAEGQRNPADTDADPSVANDSSREATPAKEVALPVSAMPAKSPAHASTAEYDLKNLEAQAAKVKVAAGG